MSSPFSCFSLIFPLLIVPKFYIIVCSDLVISSTMMSLFLSYRDLLFRTILWICKINISRICVSEKPKIMSVFSTLKYSMSGQTAITNTIGMQRKIVLSQRKHFFHVGSFSMTFWRATNAADLVSTFLARTISRMKKLGSYRRTTAMTQITNRRGNNSNIDMCLHILDNFLSSGLTKGKQVFIAKA